MNQNASHPRSSTNDTHQYFYQLSAPYIPLGSLVVIKQPSSFVLPWILPWSHRWPQTKVAVFLCKAMKTSGTHFTSSFWAHNPNLIKMCVTLTWQAMICSGHNFAHAMTAQLSWHVQICDLIGSLHSKLKWKNFQDFSLKFINPLWNGSQALL